MASEESKSWVEVALSRAAYPEKYNHYLEEGIKSLKEMGSEDIADIEAIKVLIPLDPLQTRVLDDIEFLCRLDIFGGQSHQMWAEQDKWLKEHPNNVSCNERVDALLPIHAVRLNLTEKHKPRSRLSDSQTHGERSLRSTPDTIL